MPKEYTRKQKAVIDIDHGYNMVLAGPGCGKTDILAERVVRAYENGRELSDMLCLTFTNRAAREMFNRIHERLSDNAPDLFVGNIHRYCSHFLFEEKVSGVTSESSIMDEVDTDEVLSSEIFDKDIKSLIEYKEHYVHGDLLIALNWEIVNTFLGIKRYPSGMTGLIKSSKASKIIADVRKRIYDVQHIMYQVVNNHPKEHCYKRDFLENHLLDNTFGFTEESIFIQACKRIVLCEEVFEDYKTTFLSLAYKYQQYKKRNGLLDFDDLLLYTYDAYYKDIKKEFKRFKWIQLDEIQDLSFFQLALVDLLTMKDDDYVVLYLGDEQQAIYSFMGASLKSLSFLKERCQRIYHLDKNFRSPKYLLDIYNDYAIKELNVDKEFLPKPKDEDKGGMYDVCIHEYSSEEEEAKRIKDAILPFLRDEKKERRKDRFTCSVE